MVIKKSLKFLQIIIVFFFIFSTFIQAKDIKFIPKDSIQPFCEGNINFEDKLEIEKIEIRVDKNRKWSKNLLNLHLYFQDEKAKSEHKNWFPEFRIDKKYKKNFKSKVLVKYSGLEPCIFNVRIRVTGDMWWHLNWNNGKPITSLNVKILNGHIKNITRFKLLLPQSRYGENEIFTSIFLKKAGFLSPRTFFVKAKVNGVSSNYIFQEDLRKEFLEYSLYREGPILEGDERFTISLKDSENIYENKTNLSRLVNKTYAKKNYLNSFTALYSVSNLNLLYLFNHNAEYPRNIKKNINLYLLSKDLFRNKKNRELLETYDAFIYALDAAHSLSYDDRRFYYNSLEQSLIPIYYDGKSKILEKIQITKEETLNTMSSEEAKRGALNAIDKISKIDQKVLLQNLKTAGLSLNENKLNNTIKKINKRLEIIKNSDPIKIKKSNQAKYFSLLNKKETFNKKLVLTNFHLKEFYICDFKLIACDTLKLDPLNYKDYLSDALAQDFSLFNQKLNLKTDFIFVHSDKNYENNSSLSFGDFPNWKSMKINDTLIQFNKQIDLNIDYDKKIILIKQKNKNGLLLFKHGNLKNWKISFLGSNNSPLLKSENNNPMNLTGCLNMYNLNLQNVSLFAKNTLCEDSISLINTSGNIDSIKVKNSASDSIDLDFSNLHIEKINVENALNDCLDLSFGKYIVKNIQVNKCGDKGVSVGEKSNLTIDILNASETNMAVVSKDSSIIHLNSSNISNSLLCFAAYRKKQEFSGGKIVIKKNNCNKNKIYRSKDSKIVFTNEL